MEKFIDINYLDQRAHNLTTVQTLNGQSIEQNTNLLVGVVRNGIEEDLWAPTLRQMGDALGRFIYLLDASLDYDKDLKKGSYNPYLAMGTGRDWPRWEEYLVLTMGRCTDYYERLPLVQDKPLLDNILYSGVWTVYHRKRQKEDPK